MAAYVAGIEQAGFIVNLATVGVALPTGSTGGLSFETEDAEELGAGGYELSAHGVEWHFVHVVLPAVVIVTMNTDLVAGVADFAQGFGVAASDVRGWEERAVEERADAVEFNDAGAADFFEEPRTKNTCDGAACLVGPEREKKTGRHLKLL